MTKIEVRIPMLAKGLEKGQVKATPKPDGGAIATASPSTWKPPTKKEMAKNAVHDEIRNSMRKWVAGDIPTSKHRETLRRASKALKHTSSYGLGVRQNKHND